MGIQFFSIQKVWDGYQGEIRKSNFYYKLEIAFLVKLIKGSNYIFFKFVSS